MLYEQKREAVPLTCYRDHVIRLLVNYRVAMYRIEVINGEMKIWFMGNSGDIQRAEEMMVTAEEFNKFARDFLSVKTPATVSVEREFDVEIESRGNDVVR